MKQQICGVFSLVLASASIAIAAFVMAQQSWLLLALYLVTCLAAGAAILYGFCAKCPAKAQCGHVYPGRLVLALNRPPGPYTWIELGSVGLAVLLVFGLPHYWLWHAPWLLLFFWLFALAGFFVGPGVLCRTCENIYCPANRKAAS